MECTTLKNGLRVVTDSMDHIHTINIGMWVNVGARHELDNEHGLAHMLEHMAFKGTQTRNYQEIAIAVEDVGAMMNAYTGREQTAYYFRALAEDASLCTDILGDILQNSVFDEQELLREKNVILQEIGECDDQPDDILFDHLQSIAYPHQTLGRPILGTNETVMDMKRQQLFDYTHKHYVGSNMIFAASGNIQHDTMVALAKDYFHFSDRSPEKTDLQAQWRGGYKFIDRPLEQLHLAISFAGDSYHSEDYYTAEVVSLLYGGGMSSRLFQEVREKRGLVYTISAYTNPLSDTGSFGVYAGTDPTKAPEVLEAILSELEKLSKDVSDIELKRTKAQIKASLMMGLESPSSRCEAFVKQQFTFNRFFTMQDILAKIEAVTLEDIKHFIQKLLTTHQPSIAAVGNSRLLEAKAEEIVGRYKHYSE